MNGVESMNYLETLKRQFNNRISFKEKRPGIIQIFAPFFHEDGDMLDIFLESRNGKIIISDYGMTIMRLSYTYDLDSPNKQQIFERIVAENGLQEHDGNIYLETTERQLYNALFQFAQTIAKVTTMSYYKREVLKSFFYEMLEDFVITDLNRFNPQPRYITDPQKDYLEVDYHFPLGKKSIFLFGVKDSQKARLSTIACLEFQRSKIPFTSVIVHEDFENLPKKDRKLITNAADKQFTNFDDFKKGIFSYLDRESLSV